MDLFGKFDHNKKKNLIEGLDGKILGKIRTRLEILSLIRKNFGRKSRRVIFRKLLDPLRNFVT